MIANTELPFARVCILGAGSWGTGIAVWLAARGVATTLWGHSAPHVASLQAHGTNRLYLPGIPLAPLITPTAARECAEGADLVIFVTPSKATREVAAAFSQVALAPEAIILSCTKGIEFGTGRRMSEILSEYFPNLEVAVLSGPSHAEEVARSSPAAIVIGARSSAVNMRLQNLFNAANLRAYTSDDIRGIELGGSLKNIFAIAAGVTDGLGLGDNAKAALVTRSLAEMVRLGVKLGGQAETFQGLSGLGDLMVTCFSSHSRNRLVGERLGRGEPLSAITESMTMVAEGVPTTRSAFELARHLGVATPVIDMVHALLYDELSPRVALELLYQRNPRPESDNAKARV